MGSRFKKGESGNPAGRPPKERAMTLILETEASKEMIYKGEELPKKVIVARIALDLLTKGRAELADGTVYEMGARDWGDMLRWFYNHVDGPPKQGLADLGDVDKIEVTFVKNWGTLGSKVDNEESEEPVKEEADGK
jgi:hypothetical protein